MKIINRRFVAGFAAALLLAAPLATALSSASADVLVPPSGDQTPLLDCTNAGKVFVVVTSEDGTTVSACVDAPATGTDALTAAGVTIGRDATNMICSLNNYPNPCPATFNGKYWQYYQASGQDASNGQWTYATAGSDDTTPQAGWVEGWCYGETCTPQYPGLPALNTPESGGLGTSGVVWIVVGAIVVVAIIIGVVVVVSRRRPQKAEATE